MPSFDNIFSKVKSNKAVQQMNMAAKIAKIKVEVATQKAEKERHIKTIGEKTYAMFGRDKTLEGKVVQDEIATELNLIERIDKHIEELHDEISQLQADFRNADKDVVDASEVRDTEDDDASSDESED